jgi:hypothetical protein
MQVQRAVGARSGAHWAQIGWLTVGTAWKHGHNRPFAWRLPRVARAMLVLMSTDEPDSAQFRDVTQHPGWFGWGYGSGGHYVLAIHADWPAYPSAPGATYGGLFDLAQFPRDTQFDPISDIDRCILFSAYHYNPKNPGRPKDPWSGDAYQVAIWHEDLILLQKEGLISGVTPIDEREWQLRRRIEAGWQWGRKIFFKDEQGNIHEADWPILPLPVQEEDFYDRDPYEYPAFERDGIDSPVTITANGWDVVTRELAGSIEVPESMPDLQKQLENKLYDSAIREVGIAIESVLAKAVGSEEGYGQTLVGEFIKHLKDELFAYNTALKIYRLRLRTFFKFVRNPYAHRKISVPEPQALALIAHALQLLADIQGLLEPDQDE